MIYNFFFTILVLISFCCWSSEKEFIVLQNREGAPMFNMLFEVLNLCDCYEKDLVGGMEVNFGDKGYYFSPLYGLNWFSYYFEPILIGDAKSMPLCLDNEKYINNIKFESDIPREEANRLIKKYLDLKPFMKKEIMDFYIEKMKDKYIITLHYRGYGLDKYLKSKNLQYQDMIYYITQCIDEVPRNNEYRIFVVTDEKIFLNYLIDIFGDKVIYYAYDIPYIKPGEPYNMYYNRYFIGKSSLIEAYLLAFGNVMIRTNGNLSLYSTFLNPDMKVMELNKRYYNSY